MVHTPDDPTKAQVWVEGAAPNQQVSFYIPAGPTGPQGAASTVPGPVGPVGPAGPATTDASLLSTGTVADARLPSTAQAATLAVTYASVLTSNGAADQTARINAALAAASPYGTRRRVVLIGDFTISAPLIITSDTRLNTSQAVITLASGSNCNMLTNTATTAARTFMTAGMTAASAVLTGTTSAFTAGDVGKTAYVWGAGIGGSLLQTTIASVTDANTATLAAAASTTIAVTQASIGPRDIGIELFGGRWNRGSNGGSGTGTNGHTIRFRRAESIRVTNLTVAGGTTPKYGINFGDCIDFTVRDINFDNYKSDGVHVNGPARDGTIENITGYTVDDTVSLTPNDWTPYNDVYGDITDMNITNIHPRLSDNTAVKVLGGSSSPQTKAANIRVRNVSGRTSNFDQNVGGVCWIGDDTGMSQTTGGFLHNISLENIAGTPPATGNGANNVVYLNSTNSGTVTIRGLGLDCGSTVTRHLVYVSGTANVQSLIVSDVQIRSSSSSSQIVKVDGTAAIAELIVDRVSQAPGAGSYVLQLASTTSKVYRCMMSNVSLQGGAGFVDAGPAGSRMDHLAISNSQTGVIPWGIGVFNQAARIFVANVYSECSNSIMNLGASAAVIVHGNGNFFNGKGLATSAGYTLRSVDSSLAVDVSKLTKTAGDMATNTNAALACGAGPVITDGTNWKHLFTGAIY